LPTLLGGRKAELASKDAIMTNHISTVSFHGQPLSVIPQDNQLYVAIKPICENIGLPWEGQRQRIKRDEVLNSTASMI
jgi:hypothetical protein